MYRMDGVAMMHDNGDTERLQFRDEQHCLQILHARLNSRLVGAVVVWPLREIYLKTMTNIRSFSVAEVHHSDDWQYLLGSYERLRYLMETYMRSVLYDLLRPKLIC